MEKKFDGMILNIFANELSVASKDIKYTGDLSDFGNEIGYRVYNLYHTWTEEDMLSFIRGIKHGLDLQSQDVKNILAKDITFLKKALTCFHYGYSLLPEYKEINKHKCNKLNDNMDIEEYINTI